MDNSELTMEAMREKVKKFCQIQICCLQNIPTIVDIEKRKNIILEALTGAYIAGINTGLNMSKEIEKEFSL